MDLTLNKNSEIPEQNTSKTQNLGHNVLIGNFKQYFILITGKRKKKAKQALQCQNFPGNAILS